MCDNKGPTVTIVKNNYGKVFGGYTSVSWDSTTQNWKTDSASFLFSMSPDNVNVYRVMNPSN